MFYGKNCQKETVWSHHDIIANDNIRWNSAIGSKITSISYSDIFTMAKFYSTPNINIFPNKIK